MQAQTYTLDARVSPAKVYSGYLKMGNPGPAGKEILVNSQYMTLGGKPLIPVMGEMHFSRYPRAQWEDAILKMKANGINIIATYVFWIYHEEIEDQFDWSGNKDLRSFIKLCAKHGLWVYPRIGPWCHGEVRNGGTPDWLLEKKNVTDRSNQPGYQYYADRWYQEVARQMQGLYYKDGGPVIGIQLENEYRRGKGGEAHILWLKQTAQKYGMDVPMYTVTGWGNASVPKDEVIPLFGGYPAEPWATHIQQIAENNSFSFEAPVNDSQIGADVAGPDGKDNNSNTHYPYFTCEIGIGNQITYHRRPILGPLDGLAIATGKIGSGSNLPGYYVFTGGSNPVGIYSTLEENQAETGYWNRYPQISYDFQAAIRETGELAPSYFQMKKLHYFLNEFGDRLAPMRPVIPASQKPNENLQWAVRVNGISGFIFAMNYYRGVQKKIQKNVRFTITLPQGNLVFPSSAVSIPDSGIFIWPFNFNMDGINLRYATAQPLCMMNHGNQTDWFFIQSKGVLPEICLDTTNIRSVDCSVGKVKSDGEKYLVAAIKPGISGSINVTSTNGQVIKIYILSEEEADKVWLFHDSGKKYLFLSSSGIYMNGQLLHLFGNDPGFSFISLGSTEQLPVHRSGLIKSQAGDFTRYTLSVPQKEPGIRVRHTGLFDGAEWLKAGVGKVTAKNELYHKFFIREFDAGNPSKIKSATLYLYTELPCRYRVNGVWINQPVQPGKVNQLDFTGYLHQGANTILADFPFHEGDGSFVARMDVEYDNADRVRIYSDGSWLTMDAYTYPSPWGVMKGLQSPEAVDAKAIPDSTGVGCPEEWAVTLPSLEGLNNVYLHVDYTGDYGRCYLGHRLVSDNYFNGLPWSVALKKFGSQIEIQPLVFEIAPLMPGYKIYFEKDPVVTGKAAIGRIQVVPEYAVDLDL